MLEEGGDPATPHPLYPRSFWSHPSPFKSPTPFSSTALDEPHILLPRAKESCPNTLSSPREKGQNGCCIPRTDFFKWWLLSSACLLSYCEPLCHLSSETASTSEKPTVYKPEYLIWNTCSGWRFPFVDKQDGHFLCQGELGLSASLVNGT